MLMSMVPVVVPGIAVFNRLDVLSSDNQTHKGTHMVACRASIIDIAEPNDADPVA